MSSFRKELNPTLFRENVVRIAHWKNPSTYDVQYRWWCRCGFIGQFSLVDRDLAAMLPATWFKKIIATIDAHTCITEALMDTFYRILHVVSRCLVEEVLDDSMKRFSLLEF